MLKEVFLRRHGLSQNTGKNLNVQDDLKHKPYTQKNLVNDLVKPEKSGFMTSYIKEVLFHPWDKHGYSRTVHVVIFVMLLP